MRRIFVAMAALVMTLVMCVTSLTGCGLVTVDNERDMNQVVAVVRLDETVPEEPNTIYKKDMVMAYLNYGYMYEQYYSYTRAQTFDLIIDNLVNNRVYVQYAMKEFNDNGKIEDATITDVWNAERYLDATEKNEAKYDAYKDMEKLIDSYETDKEEEKLGDTMTETVRAVPTGATNDEEVTYEEKVAFINDRNADKFGVNDSENRRKAYTEVVNVLKENDLLGGEYKATDGIVSTEYYKETLKGYYEQKLIEKHEKAITDAARTKITFDMVKSEYAELYAKQKNWSAAEFATALGSVSAAEPIVYCGFSGYGLVYNLLIGVSEELTEELTKWKEKEENKNYKEADYVEARAEIFANAKAKEQRTTWIQSGYDFDFESKKFTGDYTLTSKDNSLPFYGTVTELAAAEGDDKAEYGAVADEMDIFEFIDFVNKYVYGIDTNTTNNDDIDGKAFDGSLVAELTEYDEKIKELMFAFSTDSSDTALNTYKGYSITPTPDGSETETYMKEFAKAGRELLTMNEHSYMVVATDYGWHIMFLSERLDGRDFDTIEKYLNYAYGENKTEAEWKAYFENEVRAKYDDFEDTDHYLYTMLTNIGSTSVQKAVSDANTKVLNDYVHSGKAVTLYEDRYADLVSE